MPKIFCKDCNEPITQDNTKFIIKSIPEGDYYCMAVSYTHLTLPTSDLV